MPTKEDIAKGLIDLGMPSENRDYFIQLLDRHVPVVIAMNDDFGELAHAGIAHDYNCHQSLMILRSLLEKVKNTKDLTGHSLIQHGCKRDQLSGLIGKYKVELNKQSSTA